MLFSLGAVKVMRILFDSFFKRLICFTLLPSFFSHVCMASERLETLVVYADRGDRIVSQTTSLFGFVDSDTITLPRIEHPSQALVEVPGVWISRGSGQEHLTAIRSPVLTGAGACGAFWVGEDGIALRAAGFCNLNQLFESHYEAAESIEVFKGPHTAIVGGNAQFGAINVDLPAPDKISREASLSSSSEGYRRLQLRDGWQGQEHNGAVIASAVEDDGFRDDSGFKQQKVSLKHGWNASWLGVENGLTANHLEQETAGYIVGYEVYKDDELVRQNEFPEAYRDSDSLRAYSRWKWRKLDSEWTFTPYARSNKMAFLMHFVPWQPTEENSHDSLGWQLGWRRFLAAGTDVFWGQEYEYTWSELTETQSQPAPFRQQDFPVGVHYDYRVNAQNASLYGGAYVQMTSTLALDIAARFDYTQFDYWTIEAAGSACEPGAPNCRFYRPDDQVNDFSEPSGHVGLVYQWRDEVFFFGRLSSSFRVPQATELYRAQSSDISVIKPERSYSGEIGVRAQAGNLFVQTALYGMDNRDGIFQDTERRYVNGVESRHSGLEYELSYDRDMNASSNRWSLTATGQFAKHIYRNDPITLAAGNEVALSGNDMDTAPRNQHNLRLNWYHSEFWSMGLSWQYLGKYYLDPKNEYEYSGHNLLHLDYTYSFTPSLTLALNVHNLLDDKYADRADIAFGSYRYFPGHPRTLSIGITYQAK